MSNLSILSFQNLPIRTFSDNHNEMWFLANDICSVLGYKNSRRTVDLHCKSRGVTKRYTPTESGNQEMVYINEPNLYRLIVKSKKPEAEKFEEWVMEEVLPSIRKTGSYTHTITPEQQQQIQQAVINLHRATGEHYGRIYNRLHVQFKIPRYQDLPAAKFEEAMRFLGAGANAFTTDPNIADVITQKDAGIFYGLLDDMRYIIGWWDRYGAAIKILNKNMHTRIRDRFDSAAWRAETLVTRYNFNLTTQEYVIGYPFEGTLTDVYEYNRKWRAIHEPKKQGRAITM